MSRTRRRITLVIETNGAAFDDCEHGEIARILRTTAKSFAEQSRDWRDSGKLLDINGNTCGRVDIKTI